MNPKCACNDSFQAICEFTSENTEIPKNLPVKLRNLTINGGKFSELRDKDLANYVNLEKLQLTRNNLYKIHPNTFSNLTHLRFLVIQYNPLETLDEYSFGGIRNLTELIITNNQIRYIRQRAFYNSSNIRQFDLRHNPVERIESYAFTNVRDVEHLHLPLYVRHIEPDAFHNMSHVHFIELRYWQAVDSRPSQKGGIAPYTFRGLSHITSILIERSHLGVLHSNAFHGLSDVGILSIQKGEINTIKKDSFTGVTNVGILEIDSNLVWMVESKAWVELYSKMNSMRVVVTKNGFDCDCYNVKSFVEEMANVSRETLTANHCNVPEQLSKKSLSSITKEYFELCHSFTTTAYSNKAGATNFVTLLLLFIVLAVFAKR